MIKFLILLAIFCVYGISAYAQVQTDTISSDGLGGGGGGGEVTLSTSQTLSNKTLSDFVYVEDASTNPASTGAIRLGNNVGISWRNSGNDGDVSFFYDAEDYFDIRQAGGVKLSNNSEVVWRNEADNGWLYLLATTGDTLEWSGTGITVNSVAVPTISSTSTLTNKTLTSPDITAQTSMPTCNASNVNKIDVVQVSSTAGYPVICVNHKGAYILQPLIPSSLGVFHHTLDFVQDDNYRDDQSSGGVIAVREGTANHPGLIEIYTNTTIGGESILWMSHGPSSGNCPFHASDNFITEYVFQTGSSLSGAHIYVGPSSDTDNANATHMAIIEYVQGTDTNWQIITRDGTGEAGQTKTDSGVVVSTSTWYRALIMRNGSNIDFYLASAGGNYGSVTSHSTDIPDTDLCPTVFVQTTNTTSNAIMVDMISLTITELTR